MQKNNQLRRSTALLSGLLLSAALNAQSADTKTRLADAFARSIDAPALQLTSDLRSALSKKLKAADVETAQAMVWDAWRDANSRYKEEKLIPLQELSTQHWGAFHLPDSLEPNATLYYCYGIKRKSPLSPDSITAAEADTISSLPFFLYLHGSGPKNQEWINGMRFANYFDDAPAVYMVPQIPNEGRYYRWWQRAKQYAWEKLFRQLFLTPRIDPNRLTLFGISEGGYGSQRLASFYADYLSAAGPMAGGEPLINAPVENCANIGFSLLTGSEDDEFCRNILTERTKAAFDRLSVSHAPLFRHRIQLQAGAGHHIDYRPTTPWLRQQRRNPWPTTVMWEDFPMDSLHRKGFYNLCVVKRPADRTYYEMTISGNAVNISISTVAYAEAERDSTWDVPIGFERTYAPATGGRLKVYLNSHLVDMSRPVTVIVNGRQAFRGKLRPNLLDMAESLHTFFDPMRVYPTSVVCDF